MLVAFQQFVALLSGRETSLLDRMGEQVVGLEGCSSIGRALVSKTSGCGFKSLRPCFVVIAVTAHGCVGQWITLRWQIAKLFAVDVGIVRSRECAAPRLRYM